MRSTLKSVAHSPFNDKSRDNLIYQYFHGPPSHNGLDDLSITLIDKVNNERDLWDKEGQWAYIIKCVKPNGPSL